MAITSGLFNSINGDRAYDEKWFALYFATFIGNGVFPNPSTGLQVYANINMTTKVRTGQGWINGYFIVNQGEYILQHDNADGVLKRIDRVVMKLNHLKREIEIVVKKGAFASNPVAPTLQRDTDAYELALADVLINNGATQIAQANITDQRLNSTLCGIVHGTVDQVDTTTIFNQYQAWFNDIKGSVAGELDVWQAAQEQEFLTWFESIKDILDGDVAGNLASRIASLEQGLANHIADVSHIKWIETVGGTANALTATIDGLTSYKNGLAVSFPATSNSTAAMTLNINGLGAIPIKQANGAAFSNAKVNGVYTVRYRAGTFILQGEGGEYGNAVEGDVRKGKTIGTASGVKTGTLDLTNVKPENIRQGIIIDGVTGNLGIIGAGENQILPWEWSTTPRVTSESKPYWLLSDYGAKIEKSGKYRVKWRMSKLGSPSGGVPLTVYARLYLNDQPISGTDRQITSDTTTNDQNYTLDIDLKTGDILRCGGMTPSDSRPTLYVYIDGLFTDLKTTPVKMV